MTFRILEITSGPSREEIMNAFSNWWSKNRPSVTFKAENEGYGCSVSIIGVQSLDFEGRWLMITCGGEGRRWKVKPTDPIDWCEPAITEIKFDTRKRVGFMKQFVKD